MTRQSRLRVDSGATQRNQSKGEKHIQLLYWNSDHERDAASLALIARGDLLAVDLIRGG